MGEKLTNFLVDLASDSDRLVRFRADPVGELEEADLTGEQKAALMTQDSRRVAKVLGGWAAERAINHDLDGKKKRRRRKPAKKKRPGRRPGRPSRKKR
jgi:hypothetical protein